MRRWIAIMVGSLFLAGIGLLTGSAQAAVAQPVTHAVLVSSGVVPAQATAPNIGADAELVAADSGIVGGIALLTVGIGYYVKRSQDRFLGRDTRSQARRAAERLSSLKQELILFRNTTDEFREMNAPEYVSPDPLQDRRLRKEVADRVKARAARVIAAAQGCGYYGERVVQVTLKLMRELHSIDNIDFDPAAIELDAARIVLDNISPSQAMQLIAKQ